jgi:hypothetical protein
MQPACLHGVAHSVHSARHLVLHSLHCAANGAAGRGQRALGALTGCLSSALCRGQIIRCRGGSETGGRASGSDLDSHTGRGCSSTTARQAAQAGPAGNCWRKPGLAPAPSPSPPHLQTPLPAQPWRLPPPSPPLPWRPQCLLRPAPCQRQSGRSQSLPPWHPPAWSPQCRRPGWRRPCSSNGEGGRSRWGWVGG